MTLAVITGGIGAMRRMVLTRRGLEVWAEARLRQMIGWAITHSEYYRRAVAKGLRSEDTHNFLGRLPFIDRDSLREKLYEIATSDLSGVYFAKTSGTTGPSAKVAISSTTRARISAIKLRVRALYGVRPFDRWMVFVRDPGEHDTQGRKLISGSLRRALTGIIAKGLEVPMPGGCVDDLPLASQEAISAFKPSVIQVYPSLALLLSNIGQSKERWIRPRLTVTNGEVLFASLRRRAIRHLGCRVLDIYGLIEVNEVAWECPWCGNYHLNSDNVYAEVIDGNGQRVSAGRGELVVTSLSSWLTPIIRYRTGDVVEITTRKRPCFLPFPTLRAIHGRLSDIFRYRDLTLTSLDVHNRLDLLDINDIRSYRLRVEHRNGQVLGVTCEYTGDGGRTGVKIVQRIQERLGVIGQANVVEDLLRDPASGKFSSLQSI